MILTLRGELYVYLDHSLAEVPRITNAIQDNINVFVGEESLTYTCPFEGFPLPNITFYFNGAGISSGNDVIVIGNTLTIPSPQVNHSGIYQCIVNNDFGDSQIAWLVEIREPCECLLMYYILITNNRC